MTWLMTAAAPETMAMPKLPQIKIGQGTMPGTAMNMPTNDVKSISMTTFGLHIS